MSECMTIEDIATKNTRLIEIEDVAQDVVGCILEDALQSLAYPTDRGCNIGDFAITEDFSQQFGQFSLRSAGSDWCKPHESLYEGHLSGSGFSSNDSVSEIGQKCNLTSSVGETAAKESIDTIFQKFSIMLEDDLKKSEDINTYKVVNDQVLSQNEIRFENGQIRVEFNKGSTKTSKSDVSSQEIVENVYDEDGSQNEKILQDSSVSSMKNSDSKIQNEAQNTSNMTLGNGTSTSVADQTRKEVEVKDGRQFTPITSEALRQSILQVWSTVNPTVIGDMSHQPEEVVRLIEGLSNFQVTPNRTDDPNRPRAYSTAEEDVKKMIKEIEEINFNPNCWNAEDSETSSHHIVGQGDYDAEVESRMLFETKSISRQASEEEELTPSINFIENQNLHVSSSCELNSVPEQTCLVSSRSNIGSSFSNEACANLKTQEPSSSSKLPQDDTSAEHRDSLHLCGVPVTSTSEDCVSSSGLTFQKPKTDYDFDVNSRGIEMRPADPSETFIERSESVIQVIDPISEEENEDEEEDVKISFSLLKEVDSSMFQKDEEFVGESDYEGYLKACGSQNSKSGITTVGPLKNLDRDPKFLSGPEIDYGQMTHISRSRELVKSSSKNASIEETSMDLDDDGLEGTLINHDIASMTKVQKVKEVMCYQPSSSEDTIDDGYVARPRWDLKDVESTSEGYFTESDVGLPMIALQVTEPQSEESQEEMVQNGLGMLNESCFKTATVCLEPDKEIEAVEIGRGSCNYVYGHSYPDLPELLQEEKLTKAQSSRAVSKEKKTRNDEETLLSMMDGTQKDKEISYNSAQADQRHEHVYNINSNVRSDSVVSQKGGTLGSVFRKASNKFIRKDSDSFLRNSKSLPRDTSKLNLKLTGTDSIKSIIEDCHSSAVNMVKKSRSLLKNTQSLFKTISQTKFSDLSVHAQEKKESSCSQLELNDLEKKASTSSRKEDLLKTKSFIRSRVSKTFKLFDSSGSSDKLPENSAADPKDSSLVLRNEKDFRVERIENIRKQLSKSPLVYRSQFVQSHPMEINLVESEEFLDSQDEILALENQMNHIEGNSKSFSGIQNGIIEPAALATTPEKEIDTSVEETLEEEWVHGGRGDLQPPSPQSGHSMDYTDQVEPEPIQPKTDAEVGLYPDRYQEKEIYEEGSQSSFDIKLNIAADKDTIHSKPLLNKCDGTHNMAVCNDLRETSSKGTLKNKDKALAATPSEIKKRRKNKKLSARIRSFWNSAFGKGRTSKKTDTS